MCHLRVLDEYERGKTEHCNTAFSVTVHMLLLCFLSWKSALWLFKKRYLFIYLLFLRTVCFDPVLLLVEDVQVNKGYNCFLFRKLSTLSALGLCSEVFLSTSPLHTLGDKVCHSSRRKNLLFQWQNENHCSVGKGMYSNFIF